MSKSDVTPSSMGGRPPADRIWAQTPEPEDVAAVETKTGRVYVRRGVAWQEYGTEEPMMLWGTLLCTSGPLKEYHLPPGSLS